MFLAEKTFEGCGGLEMTDAIRVTIAAQACLLLLHRETDYFPDLEVILVYPHTYVAKTSAGLVGGAAIADEQARLGQSASGVVVLAWDAVRHGATDAHDGHNVMLHEFAHQLDQEDGAADGAPLLGKRAMYTAWARVFGEEFAHLVENVDKHRKRDIDAYGATSLPSSSPSSPRCSSRNRSRSNAAIPSSTGNSRSFTARIPRRTRTSRG
jgi:hypothetical protein